MAAPLSILMVAEKPSIADTLAHALCPPGVAPRKRRGVSPSSPVHEYDGDFLGAPARYKVTATTGHVYSLDFSQEYNNWDKHSPDALFAAETVRTYDPRARMPDHLRQEGQGCDVLVLWLDCDREGENICFEVIGEVFPQMRNPPRHEFPGSFLRCIYRANFSSLAQRDLQAAFANLSIPNEDEAASVDARQEVDLRVGVAFSRLQTMYFRKHFGHQLGRKMVTYGPCQIPTLWFCVKRHVEVEAFVPEPFWLLSGKFKLPGIAESQVFDVTSDRGAIWDSAEAKRLLASAKAAVNTGEVRVARLRGWQSRASRPLPLNTVEMLKMASEVLGLGPGDALHIAEGLYLKGILSYPRTETDMYPVNFDLLGTIEVMSAQHLPWASEARELLDGYTAPSQDGHDAGDHPPITPVKAATRPQCGDGAGWALYCEVCRHFLATVSPDATFREAEATFVLQVAEGETETLQARSSRCINKGWLEVGDRRIDDQGAVDLSASLAEGAVVSVQGLSLENKLTKAPPHISESELLGLMEQHSIGTDASMATHVSNVQNRNYVELDESTRRMRPSPLGIALCHAYALIDQDLVLPTVRASIENACDKIAKGLEAKNLVVSRSLRIFQRKFFNFARQIDRLPQMLAVAHARERGNVSVASDAANEALQLWEQAVARTSGITLEELLARRDAAEINSADAGAEQQTGDIRELVMNETPAVQRVQRVLQELGMGAAEESRRRQERESGEQAGRGKGNDKGEGKGKAKGEGKDQGKGKEKGEGKGKGKAEGKGKDAGQGQGDALNAQGAPAAEAPAADSGATSNSKKKKKKKGAAGGGVPGGLGHPPQAAAAGPHYPPQASAGGPGYSPQAAAGGPPRQPESASASRNDASGLFPASPPGIVQPGGPPNALPAIQQMMMLASMQQQQQLQQQQQQLLQPPWAGDPAVQWAGSKGKFGKGRQAAAGGYGAQDWMGQFGSYGYAPGGAPGNYSQWQ